MIHAIVLSIPLFTFFPWIVQYVSKPFTGETLRSWKSLKQLHRLVSHIPEQVLLWAFPQGQMFNVFKDVRFAFGNLGVTG